MTAIVKRLRPLLRLWVLCLTGLAGLWLPTACTRPEAAWPAAIADGAPIFPDYTADDLVLPVNIAPLNFMVSEERLPQAAMVRLEAFAAQAEDGAPAAALDVRLRRKDGRLQCRFPVADWHRCLQQAAGGHVRLGIRNRKGQPLADAPVLRWTVSADSIDPYLVYRLSAYDENPCVLQNSLRHREGEFFQAPARCR